MTGSAAPAASAPIAAPGNAPALRYRNVSFAYPPAAAEDVRSEARLVLENITLDVQPGEKLGILGPNGGGKSTLLKLTLGLLRGGAGEISILGLAPDAARRARVIGYVPQRVEAELAFPLSVREVVTMSATVDLAPWRTLSAVQNEAIAEALDVTGMRDLADRPIGALSGGQVQRAMIARALACRPRILLLDEPMVGVDVRGQQQFAQLVDQLAATGLTIVVVSHDLRTVAAGCDRVACLSRTLHYHLAPRGLTPQVLAEVFRHDVAAIFGEIHVDAHTAATCATPAHHRHAPGCTHEHMVAVEGCTPTTNAPPSSRLSPASNSSHADPPVSGAGA